MAFGGIIGGILDRKHEAEQTEIQQKQFHAAQLGKLLDDPNINLDAKSAIATQLDELMKTPPKQKGMLEGLAHIFHGQQKPAPQSAAPSPLAGLYGDLGQQVPVETVAPQQATKGEAGSIESQIGAPPPMTLTKRRGALTSQDLSDADKLRLFGQEQGIRAKYDEQNDQRTQDRQLAVQQVKNTQASQLLAQRLHNQGIMLDAREQARARREVEARIASGMSPETAEADVRQKFTDERGGRQAKIDLYRAQTLALPERTKQGWERVEQGWKALDLNDIRTQVYADLGGNKQNMDRFERENKDAFEELKSTRQSMQDLMKRPDLLNSPDHPEFKQELQQLQAYESSILNRIWTSKGTLVPSTPATSPTVPQRGSKGSKYVAPKVSADKLQSLMAP